MKNLITSIFVAVLLIGATPATQAQQSNTLTAKQAAANKMHERILGDWQVSRYVRDADGKGLVETKGSTKFSKAYQGDYVQEHFTLTQADGTTLQGESYIRYCDDKDRYEYVQLDKQGKSIVMMTGKWSKKYDTLIFKPLQGEEQWSKKIDPNLHCLYIFKTDGTFVRLTRTFDRHGNFVVLTQDHYSYPGVATL